MQCGPRSKVRQDISQPDLDLICLTLKVFVKDFFSEKVDYENNPRMTKSIQNYPACRVKHKCYVYRIGEDDCSIIYKMYMT